MFLVRGRFRNLLERAVGITLGYQRSRVARVLSFDFMVPHPRKSLTRAHAHAYTTANLVFVLSPAAATEFTLTHTQQQQDTHTNIYTLNARAQHQQLVWHGLSEFFLFLLPLINFRKLRLLGTRVYRLGTLPSCVVRSSATQARKQQKEKSAQREGKHPQAAAAGKSSHNTTLPLPF